MYLLLVHYLKIKFQEKFSLSGITISGSKTTLFFFDICMGFNVFIVGALMRPAKTTMILNYKNSLLLEWHLVDVGC
jgi:hypothetical protein